MLKALIKRYVKKHGMLAIMMKVGDIAVKATKSKKDDEDWAKIKKLIDNIA
jgi:hypothetical protein